METGTLNSFIALSFLEVILNIDNLILIAILADKLPKKQAYIARIVGLSIALAMRTVMLFSLSWLIGLKDPLFFILGFGFSGQALLLIAGGVFLIYKACDGIADEVVAKEKEHKASRVNSFSYIVLQIVFIDFVFSFDSVITAIGLTTNIPVIVAAMSVAMLIMIFAANYVSLFIEKYPSVKILAWGFIFLIGVFLLAEAFGLHFSKNYLYFSMLFAVVMETINIFVKKKNKSKEEANLD